MADYDFNSIFEQINNLKKPTTQTEEVRPEKDELREVLNSVSDEIKRVYAGGFVPHYRDVTVKHQ